jgi:hypothetical protein
MPWSRKPTPPIRPRMVDERTKNDVPELFILPHLAKATPPVAMAQLLLLCSTEMRHSTWAPGILGFRRSSLGAKLTLGFETLLLALVEVLPPAHSTSCRGPPGAPWPLAIAPIWPHAGALWTLMKRDGEFQAVGAVFADARKVLVLHRVKPLFRHQRSNRLTASCALVTPG